MEGKGENLKAEEYHSNCDVGKGMATLRVYQEALENNYYLAILKQHLKTSGLGIKAWAQICFPNGRLFFGVTIQNIDLSPVENVCVNKNARFLCVFKLRQFTGLVRRNMKKNPTNYNVRLVKEYPNCLK